MKSTRIGLLLIALLALAGCKDHRQAAFDLGSWGKANPTPTTSSEDNDRIAEMLAEPVTINKAAFTESPEEKAKKKAQQANQDFVVPRNVIADNVRQKLMEAIFDGRQVEDTLYLGQPTKVIYGLFAYPVSGDHGGEGREDIRIVHSAGSAGYPVYLIQCSGGSCVDVDGKDIGSPLEVAEHLSPILSRDMRDIPEEDCPVVGVKDKITYQICMDSEGEIIGAYAHYTPEAFEED